MYKYIDGALVEMTHAEITTRQAEESAALLDAVVSARKSATMSRADFAVASHAKGWLTEAEAEEWAAGVAIPPIATRAISKLPQELQLKFRIAVRTQTDIGRTDALILTLMAEEQVDDAEMDAVFDIEATTGGTPVNNSSVYTN